MNDLSHEFLVWYYDEVGKILLAVQAEHTRRVAEWEAGERDDWFERLYLSLKVRRSPQYKESVDYIAELEARGEKPKPSGRSLEDIFKGRISPNPS